MVQNKRNILHNLLKAKTSYTSFQAVHSVGLVHHGELSSPSAVLVVCRQRPCTEDFRNQIGSYGKRWPRYLGSSLGWIAVLFILIRCVIDLIEHFLLSNHAQDHNTHHFVSLGAILKRIWLGTPEFTWDIHPRICTVTGE